MGEKGTSIDLGSSPAPLQMAERAVNEHHGNLSLSEFLEDVNPAGKKQH